MEHHNQQQSPPPSEYLHPILLFDEYLFSAMQKCHGSNNNDDGTNTNTHADNDKDEENDDHVNLPCMKSNNDKALLLDERRTCVLQVADFLFGGGSSSASNAATTTTNNNNSHNILEAALAVLDSLTEYNTIQRIKSNPSGRIAYVVKGMTTTASSSNRNPQEQDQSSPTSSSSKMYYFCLMPPINQISKQRELQQQSPFVLPSLFYCTCRSYFEKAKQDPNALCKHLLALKLMEHMECPCNELSVPDSEYANLILQKVFT